MYLLSVAVANRPAASTFVAVATGASEGTSSPEALPLLPPELLLLLELFLDPRTPLTTAATMTTKATGIPNLIHGLSPFFFAAAPWGLMNPVADSVKAGSLLPYGERWGTAP